MKTDPPNHHSSFETSEHAYASEPIRADGYMPISPGSRVGAYTVIKLIGEGGMGSVFLADQEQPSRKVALKVLKPGMASAQALKRFRHESEILGRLQHPGIAQIYEAGMHGGAPYFAMEYIEGQTLSEFAIAEKLGTHDRLRLFAKVCEAVYHAHAKGIIHRDLKPGNILVTKIGEPPEPQPKVLDFGVARATDADIKATTLQTDIGQLIGTVPYMSPEQVAGDPNELDTRSDVYALGVVLYELLTGRLPYNLSNRMIHEAARIIREDDPTRLSLNNPKLRGDIETIVGMALEKEKDRRYQSALDLASDIRRHLGHEPIAARPPSTWYQLAKFSRRNKALVGGVIATIVVLTGGVVASSAYAIRADRARLETAAALADRDNALESEQERSGQLQRVSDFQAEHLANVDPHKMGIALRDGLRSKIRKLTDRQGLDDETTAALLDNYDQTVKGADFTGLALDTLDSQIFEPALEAINAQFGDQPLVQAQLLQALANTLRELGLLDAATDPQEQALLIRRERLGSEHLDTLNSTLSLGDLLSDQGKLDEAEPYYRELLETSRRVLGDEHPGTLNAVGSMGTLLAYQGKLAEAEPYYREALETSRRVLGDDHPDTLISINSMGFLLDVQSRYAEAEPYYREALETRRRVLGDDHPSTLNSIGNLGALLVGQGKLADAEAYFHEVLDTSRRVLGDEHPDTLISIANMGTLLSEQGKLAEAERYYSEALETSRRVLGDEHPSTLTSIGNMGSLLLDLGRPEEAEPYFHEALETSRRVLGGEDPYTPFTIFNMGDLLQSQGRLEEAEPYFREALEMRRHALGDDHPDTLYTIDNIGELLQNMGKLGEAEPYFREALEGYRRVLGDDHPATLASINTLASFYDEQTRWQESEVYRLLFVKLTRRAEPKGGPRLGSALVKLGINLIKQDRPADAEPVLTECLEIRRRVLPEGHWLIWNTQSLLGETIAAQSRFTQAEPLLTEAAEQIKPPEQSMARLEEARQRVIDLYTAWHAAEPGGGYDVKVDEWQSKPPNQEEPDRTADPD